VKIFYLFLILFFIQIANASQCNVDLLLIPREQLFELSFDQFYIRAKYSSEVMASEVLENLKASEVQILEQQEFARSFAAIYENYHAKNLSKLVSDEAQWVREAAQMYHEQIKFYDHLLSFQRLEKEIGEFQLKMKTLATLTLVEQRELRFYGFYFEKKVNAVMDSFMEAFKRLQAENLNLPGEFISLEKNAKQIQANLPLVKNLSSSPAPEFYSEMSMGGGIQIKKSSEVVLEQIDGQHINGGEYLIYKGERVGVYKPKHKEYKDIQTSYNKKGYVLDDTPIVHQTAYLREVATSLLNDALAFNVVPKTVLVTVDGEVGSMMHYLDGYTPYSDAREVYNINSKLEPKEYIMPTDRERLHEMALIDMLTFNMDRHEGNWLVSFWGDVQAIDNGYSFPLEHFSGMRRIWTWESVRSITHHPVSENIVGKIQNLDFEKIATNLKVLGIEEEAIRLFEHRFTVIKNQLTKPKELYFVREALLKSL